MNLIFWRSFSKTTFVFSEQAKPDNGKLTRFEQTNFGRWRLLFIWLCSGSNTLRHVPSNSKIFAFMQFLFRPIVFAKRHAGFLFVCRIWSSQGCSIRRQCNSGRSSLAPRSSSSQQLRSAGWQTPHSCRGGHSQTRAEEALPELLLWLQFGRGCWRHAWQLGSCGREKLDWEII